MAGVNAPGPSPKGTLLLEEECPLRLALLTIHTFDCSPPILCGTADLFATAASHKLPV